MKHLVSFPSLLAALCLAIPATGFSDDHHHDHGDWHGNYRYYGHGYHHYRPFFPFFGIPAFAVGYGYYGPSVGVTVDSSEPAPTYRGAPTEDRGDRGEDLAIDVQRSLRQNGYYRGDIDGDIGAGTRGAIRQYQYDHRLEVTGRIDRALLDSLGLD